MRILLIANPTAGQGKVRWIVGMLQSSLERFGAEVTVVLTGGPKDAAEAAEYARVSGRFDRVVAGGGDGTINQIVNALVGTEIPLAILPLGTANSLAREIKLPFNLPGAARVAVQGPAVPVDVGRAGDAYFLLEASAGFDAAVVTSVQQPQKRWLGPFAYVFNGLDMLRTYAPFDLKVDCDGVEYHTRANMIMAANTATYAYGFRLAGKASIHDGLMDICVLEAGEHPFRRQVTAALLNRLGPGVGVRTYRGRRIRISSDPPIPVQIDGDPAGSTPIEVEAVPEGLLLAVPERYARRVARLKRLAPAAAAFPPGDR